MCLFIGRLTARSQLFLARTEPLELAGQIPIQGGDPSVVIARDVNDDGQLDLIVANTISAVAVLHGNGNGRFQAPQYDTAGFALRSLAVADLNDDGELDITG